MPDGNLEHAASTPLNGLAVSALRPRAASVSAVAMSIWAPRGKSWKSFGAALSHEMRRSFRHDSTVVIFDNTFKSDKILFFANSVSAARTSWLLLLHGFIKKTQKTPQSDLNLALKRKKEIT
jgi:hypothetical protein